MIPDLLLPLITVGLAELGDKTQLSVLLLASRTKNHMELFVGVMMGFLVVDGAAVLIGSSVAELLPISVLKPLSGIIFVIFGILMLRQKDDGSESQTYSRNPLLSGLIMILLAEWGDKTQIAAAIFAAEYNPLQVLIGVMAALTMLSVIAIYLGRFIAQRINCRLISKIAGTLFILIGISFALSAINLYA